MPLGLLNTKLLDFLGVNTLLLSEFFLRHIFVVASWVVLNFGSDPCLGVLGRFGTTNPRSRIMPYLSSRGCNVDGRILDLSYRPAGMR